MANLITLSEYKTYVGMNPTDTRKDTQITALIPAASRAIEAYTDRRFEQLGGSTARTFDYDGSGTLDIDDCTDVVDVVTDGGWPAGPVIELDPVEYTPMPYRETTDDDPHYYIQMHWFPRGYSPQMGFTRNLDTMDNTQGQVLVTVTASWGWASTPEDVKLATAWTVQDSLNSPSSNDLKAESIEGYSRSWGSTPAGQSLALPARSRDLLSAYVRVF